MYLVGKVKKIFDGQTVAWEMSSIRLTRRGAVKDCTTENHFFIKARFGIQIPDVETIFPKRYR